MPSCNQPLWLFTAARFNATWDEISKTLTTENLRISQRPLSKQGQARNWNRGFPNSSSYHQPIATSNFSPLVLVPTQLLKTKIQLLSLNSKQLLLSISLKAFQKMFVSTKPDVPAATATGTGTTRFHLHLTGTVQVGNSDTNKKKKKRHLRLELTLWLDNLTFFSFKVSDNNAVEQRWYCIS